MEAETKAMMQFSKSRRFVLSANFHGGSVVVNYPFDGNKEGRSGKYTKAPYDSIFKALSITYASANKDMVRSGEFPNGITNGAAWYVLYGGMQDWNYLTLGDLELTVELSDNKWPDASQLDYFWGTNYESMLRYLEAVQRGIRGTVTTVSATAGAEGSVIVGAKVIVEGLMVVLADDQWGDYYKVLLPGTYTVTALADGFKPQIKTAVVTTDTFTVVNFNLEKK